MPSVWRSRTRALSNARPHERTPERTEQALNLALAERYVQGVSTRKVCDILVKLLGPNVSISSTPLSRTAETLEAGLKTAPRAVLPSVRWQRGPFHLPQNAQAYVTRLDQRKPVAWRTEAPDFAQFCDLPHAQRARLRTTNGLERINREIRFVIDRTKGNLQQFLDLTEH